MLLRRSDKKLFLVCAVLLLVATVASWVSVSAISVKKAGTVELSVGKEIYLGEPRVILENDLKANLISNVGNYSYTGSSGKNEGVVFMTADKVSAISITSNVKNWHKQTQIGIATSATAISGSAVKSVNQLARGQNLSGFKFNSSGIIGYYLTDPCSSSQKVLAVIVAKASSQNLALPKVNKVEPCGSNDGGE